MSGNNTSFRPLSRTYFAIAWLVAALPPPLSRHSHFTPGASVKACLAFVNFI
jgi:hypothetical protein